MILQEGRADISRGEGCYFWRGGLIFHDGVYMFVEGRAEICGG